MTDSPDITALLAEVRRLADISQRWLRISEAERYAKLSRENLVKLLNNGEIRGRKREVGGWIVDRESIDEYNAGYEDALYSDLQKRLGGC